MVIALLLILAGGGVFAADEALGGPNLSFDYNDISASGGSAEVAGTVTNSGAGDAQNVAITVNVAAGGGLSGAATIPKLARGASAPFTTSIDLAGGSLPIDAQTSWKTQWDGSNFDTQDDTGSFQYTGHVHGTRRGSLHNAGPADAQDVVLTITFSGGVDGKDVITSGSNNLGTIAAGASVPYSVTADLGSNPSDTIYWDWEVAWSEPNVSAADIKSTWVGGTVVMAGTVTNRGKARADNVVVARTLLDANGKAIGTVTANLGRLAPGARTEYRMTFPLDQKSFRDIKKTTIKVTWKELHYFFLSVTRTQTRQEAVV
ncbi:MAG: hypothetical protein E6I63_09245 [Chloroflexi bacterium]|nr:MAG: hypothetical protein E6I63_09245 [Chloroflexota bacterium]